MPRSRLTGSINTEKVCDWPGLLAAVSGAVAYSLLAVAVFRAGLRRYESGNRFGVRA